MQTLNYTDDYLRRRKFYVFLPLLALPFLTFIYWILVVKNLKTTDETTSVSGLQLKLPDASLKDEGAMDKWQYYRKADRDSAARMQQIKRDPYRNGEELTASNDTLHSQLRGLEAPGPRKKALRAASQTSEGSTSHEIQVQRSLRNLEKAMASTSSPKFAQTSRNLDSIDGRADQNDIAKIEALLRSSESQAHLEQVDPELAQLNGMLDKILAIQNPSQNTGGLLAEPADASSPSLPVIALGKSDVVSILPGQLPTDSLQQINPVTKVGFFGLGDEQDTPASDALTAVIENTQQLVSGSTVQLRLTSALNVAAQSIPQNTFIYGIASLSGERLKIKISTISSDGKILPVNLGVYDLDGIEGIYIPGTISRTITKQALGSQVQGADFDVGGFSLGAQAANAGMQIGRTLLGRKTRLTQVTLQSGYKVILRDEKNMQPQTPSNHEK
jgi:conjugative transposon TraM protein